MTAQDAALAELDAPTERYEGRIRLFDYDSQTSLLGAERVSEVQQIFGKRAWAGFRPSTAKGRS